MTFCPRVLATRYIFCVYDPTNPVRPEDRHRNRNTANKDVGGREGEGEGGEKEEKEKEERRRGEGRLALLN